MILNNWSEAQKYAQVVIDNFPVLTTEDQINLMIIENQLLSGESSFIYHATNKPCRIYTKDDMLKIINGSNNIKSFMWKDRIIELSKLNNLDIVLKKINILIDVKDSIKFNVNGNLLIDNVIISVGGMTDGSRY